MIRTIHPKVKREANVLLLNLNAPRNVMNVQGKKGFQQNLAVLRIKKRLQM
jgi:hypothetical protein